MTIRNLIMPDELMPIILQKIENVEKDLADLLGIQVKVRLQLHPTTTNEKMLQMLVCDAYQVSWECVAGKSQKQQQVFARHAYCYLAHHYMYLHKHHTELMGTLGGRDRTTILNSIKTATNMLETNHAPFSNPLKQIIKLLKGDGEIQN